MIVAFDFGITNTDLAIKDNSIQYLSVPSSFNEENGDFNLTENHVLKVLQLSLIHI